MVPPLPTSGVDTVLSAPQPIGMGSVLTSGGETSVGEYETYEVGIRHKGAEAQAKRCSGRVSSLEAGEGGAKHPF